MSEWKFCSKHGKWIVTPTKRTRLCPNCMVELAPKEKDDGQNK